MGWLEYSLLRAICLAASNIFDKVLLSKIRVAPSILLLQSGVFDFLVITVLISFYGAPSVTYQTALIGIMAGLFFFIALWLYFEAVEREEVSRIIPLFYLDTIAIAFLSRQYLSEHLSLIEISGVICLLIGAITLGYSPTAKFKWRVGAWYALASGGVYALDAVLEKYLLQTHDVFTVFILARLGGVLGSFLAIPKAFRSMRETSIKTFFLPALASETLYMAGIYFSTMAMFKGSATLANAVSASAPFFVLAFAYVLSTKFPKLLEEDNSSFLKRLAATTVMFAGILLLS